MRGLACGVGVVALMLGGAMARAEDGAEPVHVVFEPGAACSDEPRFLEEVRGRTPRVRPAEAGEPARTFRVRIGGGGPSYSGTLTIEDGARVSAPRTLAARACEELVAALAFIAALSVDPRAHVDAVLARPSAQPAPPAPPPEPPPAPAWVAAEPPDSSAPSQAPAPVPPTAAPEPPVQTRAAPPRRAAPFLSVGAGPTLALPDAPAGGVGGRAFVELGRAVPRGFSPSARLSFDLPGQRVLPSGSAQATLAWTRGALDACPLRIALGESLVAATCGGLEVGALRGHASDIVNARASTQRWLAGLLEARLRFAFLRVLFAEIDAGIALPVTRSEFVFNPSTTLYQAPPAFVRGLLAAGARFP